MAEKRIFAKEGQSIYDIVAQEYGDMSFLKDFLDDNELDYSTILKTNQELIINSDGKGNETIKDQIRVREISVNNNQEDFLPPLQSGDFNIDFNNDFY